MSEGAEKPERKVTVCENCGQLRECEQSVNPYAAEISKDFTPFWLCDPCCRRLAAEI